MTAKNWKKAFKQIEHKKAERTRQLKFNKPKDRICGRGTRRCELCDRRKSLIRRFSLNICRQCFRDVAHDIGFRKY